MKTIQIGNNVASVLFTLAHRRGGTPEMLIRDMLAKELDAERNELTLLENCMAELELPSRPQQEKAARGKIALSGLPFKVLSFLFDNSNSKWTASQISKKVAAKYHGPEDIRPYHSAIHSLKKVGFISDGGQRGRATMWLINTDGLDFINSHRISSKQLAEEQDNG